MYANAKYGGRFLLTPLTPSVVIATDTPVVAVSVSITFSRFFELNL